MSSHAPGTPARTYPPRPEAVYFYGTCLVDTFVPEAGMDAIALLEREGIRVIFPDNQTCCGQPAFTSGFPDEARQVVESQLGLFPGDYPIVVPSGSCGGMIRWHWEKVVGNDPALKARAAPDDVVFIFARAAEGPRMPLAVVRTRVADLPREFTLDDSMAISPEFKLSSAGSLRIEARVSRSGDATAKPGDLRGESGPVQPGARKLSILIDKVVE